MSWIGITDRSDAAFNLRGIGVPKHLRPPRPAFGPDAILTEGSLLFEVNHDAGAHGPRHLLRYRRNRGWRREVDIFVTEAGRLVVTMRQGAARSRVGLDLPAGLPQDSRLRVLYAWRAPERVGWLSVELLDDGRLLQARVRDPIPLPVADAKFLFKSEDATEIGDGVRFLALADSIEPIGLPGGVAEGTPIETDGGPVPIERLRLGDRVVTAHAGLQPVRWIGRRQVPALGGLRPVRVRAPFFGLGEDVLLSPDQRVRIGSTEAEYLLGEDEVLMPALHLVNGQSARRDHRLRMVTYYQVLLDVHDCLSHDGLWSESLFVGAIGRDAGLLTRTVLAELPATAIPRHRGFSRHKLTAFEARNLAAEIRA